MPQPTAEQRLHAVVRGRVQGVGFRAYVRARGAALGLCGWVRNTPEGHVEVVGEGPPGALRDLLVALRTGPPAAIVTDVEVDWDPPRGEPSGFRVRF
ncbi:MAG: acylphosphatase [Armatimonadetes bacterium]|nr:acylphosphatase [Armatimonadota bacterium]